MRVGHERTCGRFMLMRERDMLIRGVHANERPELCAEAAREAGGDPLINIAAVNEAGRARLELGAGLC